jgi:hypothetical protein
MNYLKCNKYYNLKRIYYLNIYVLKDKNESILKGVGIGFRV